KDGPSVYRVLREIENVEIVGVADRNLNSPGMLLARRDQVYVTNNITALVADPAINVIMDMTESPAILTQIQEHKNKQTQLLQVSEGSLLKAIIKSKIDEKKLQSELWVILNSVQEGVAIADRAGILKYINPAFERMTGVKGSQQVGNNIFEVNPHGALAQTLIKHRALSGFRTKIENVDVMANAAPIIVDGEVDGAVVICQPITDILQLMEDLNKSTTIIENLYARIDQMTGAKFTFNDLIGNSKLFHSMVEMAKRAAKNDLPILITGEGGTRKDIFAQAIHRASSRRNKPFIKVVSTSIPEELLTSELFGHENGAFAGAVKTVLGKVEMVKGGTIYIENVSEFNLYLQSKLIQLLRDGEFQPLGSNEVRRADVRVITSTKKNLKVLVQEGRFSEELYYLLNVFELNLPPLRQRQEDIAILTEHFVTIFNRKFSKQVKCIAPEVKQLLANYDWPGNVSELENVIERAMAMVEGNTLKRQHLSPYISQFNEETMNSITKIMPLDKMEQIMLKAALARFGETLEGKKKAAQALNISLATLYNKLKKYKSSI
ncbi:MAG: sigma 54-interacting transcriptional regulator, partial [Firmicutes bacterium]|nr:sigma 54-interacting transcriptional regulator [Bacillota bacterium]